MPARRKKKRARKSSRIEKFHGWLVDAVSGARWRAATAREAKAFRPKKATLVIDGRAVKLARTVKKRRKGPRKKRAKKKRAKKGR